MLKSIRDASRSHASEDPLREMTARAFPAAPIGHHRGARHRGARHRGARDARVAGGVTASGRTDGRGAGYCPGRSMGVSDGGGCSTTRVPVSPPQPGATQGHRVSPANSRTAAKRRAGGGDRRVTGRGVFGGRSGGGRRVGVPAGLRWRFTVAGDGERDRASGRLFADGHVRPDGLHAGRPPVPRCLLPAARVPAAPRRRRRRSPAGPPPSAGSSRTLIGPRAPPSAAARRSSP